MTGLREVPSAYTPPTETIRRQPVRTEALDTARDLGFVFSKLTVLLAAEDPDAARKLPRVAGTTVDLGTRVESLGDKVNTLATGEDLNLDRARQLTTYLANRLGMQTVVVAEQNGQGK